MEQQAAEKAVESNPSEHGFEVEAEKSGHAGGMGPVAWVADEDIESEGCEEEGSGTHLAGKVVEDGLEVEVLGEEVGHPVVDAFFFEAPGLWVNERMRVKVWTSERAQVATKGRTFEATVQVGAEDVALADTFGEGCRGVCCAGEYWGCCGG